MTNREQDGERHDVVITRVFDAPRDLVFEVWTNPQFVALWWGIEHCTILVHDLELRAGGQWRIEMQTKAGDVYPNGGTVLEVIQNERFVYTDVFDRTDPIWNGHPPPNSVQAVCFDDFEGSQRTKVTITVSLKSASDKADFLRRGITHGIEEALTKLEGILPELQKQVRFQ